MNSEKYFPNPLEAEKLPAIVFIPSLEDNIKARLDPKKTTPEDEQQAVIECMALISKAANFAAMAAFMELMNQNVGGYESLIKMLREGVAEQLIEDLMKIAKKAKKDPDTKTTTSEVDLQTEADDAVTQLKKSLGLK